MKLLTIKQPWASLICLGIKDVENRTWKQNCLIGETILIMSSLGVENMAATNQTWCVEYQRLVSIGAVPRIEKLPRGVIIGYVDVVDIKEKYDSLWAADASHYKYILKDPHMFITPLEGVRGQPKPINYDISIDELLAIPTI